MNSNKKKILELLSQHKDLSMFLEKGVILLPSTFLKDKPFIFVSFPSIPNEDGIAYTKEDVPVLFYQKDEFKQYQQVNQLFLEYGLQNLLQECPKLYDQDVHFMKEMMQLCRSYGITWALKGNRALLCHQKHHGISMQDHIEGLIRQIRIIDQTKALDWSIPEEVHDIIGFHNKTDYPTTVEEIFRRTPSLWTRTTEEMLRKNILILRKKHHVYSLQDCGMLLAASEVEENYDKLMEFGFSEVIERAPYVLTMPFAHICENVTLFDSKYASVLYPYSALGMDPKQNQQIAGIIEEYQLDPYKTNSFYGRNPQHIRFVIDFMITRGLFHVFKQHPSMVRFGNNTLLLREAYFNAIGEKLNTNGYLHQDFLLKERDWNMKYPAKHMLETVFQVPVVTTDSYKGISVSQIASEQFWIGLMEDRIRESIEILMNQLYQKAKNRIVWKIDEDTYVSLPKLKRILCEDGEALSLLDDHSILDETIPAICDYLFVIEAKSMYPKNKDQQEERRSKLKSQFSNSKKHQKHI